MGKIAFWVALAPQLALAFPSGVSGYSTNGCSGCHVGSNTATRPTVTLQGPAQVTAGSTTDYTLTISGPAGATAALDVSISGGTLQTSDTTEQLVLGELTQKTDPAMTAQAYTFPFKVIAGTGSSFTLSATGMSSNGDGTANGDKDNQATMTVAIAALAGGGGGTDAGSPMPDAGPGGPPPSGGPTVGLVQPTMGSTVSGMLEVQALAMSGAGIESVSFGVDGDDYAVSTAMPYAARFDTTLLANGQHTFTARAVDNAGNQVTSSAAVTVKNPLTMQRGGCGAAGAELIAPALLALLGLCRRQLRGRR